MNNCDYFAMRNVNTSPSAAYAVPRYLSDVLDKSASILDFGCGFGQLLFALRYAGYSALEGADIDIKAAQQVARLGIRIHDLSNEPMFFSDYAHNYDYVILSHVLEHLNKHEIIPKLQQIRNLLNSTGKLIVMVPNAQANTGCYWAYEDFTHSTMFTTGSLYYVLRAAGFSTVDFIDINCLAGLSLPKKLIRIFLLSLYKLKLSFWNKVTSSVLHESSPQIYSFEIKAVAHV